MDKSNHHFQELRGAIADAHDVHREADQYLWADLSDTAGRIRGRIRLHQRMLRGTDATPAQHMIDAEAIVAECLLIEAEMRRKPRQSQAERELFYESRITRWLTAFEHVGDARSGIALLDGAAAALEEQIAIGYTEAMNRLIEEDRAALHDAVDQTARNVLRAPVKRRRLRELMRRFAEGDSAGA